jgi:P pilus assembly chaperone PapD
MSLRNAAVLCCLLPLCAVAGSLRVGPTRLELSARHPVAVLEVQNTGDQPSFVQLDAFLWTQAGTVDLLESTTQLITTPLVVNLAPGATRLVRVGLREPAGPTGQPNRTTLERSYRVFVREVPPAARAESGLRFAVRIGVPVFALPGESHRTAAGGGRTLDELTWRWLPGGPMGQPDLHGCASVQLFNPSARHDRVLAAEIRNASGEVLWRASEPVYVLAESKRSLQPALCAPSLKEATTLRLTTESHTFDLPVEASALLVDANAH